jgi:hypothetical protein
MFYKSYRHTEVPIAVAHKDIRTIKVQVVCVRTTEVCRGPIVAVNTIITHRSTTTEANSWNKY